MKKSFLNILFIIIFILPIIVRSENIPTDDELLELERQIELQEIEQENIRQRAEEEARREREKQKLKEERALLEEERRKLEEEKQAELLKKQMDEEQKRIQLEEEQRAAAEAEIRRQYEQHMNNAANAMNNQDYQAALQSYTQALEIIPNDPTAINERTKANEYVEFCSLLVGEWTWFLAKLVVHENGTMQAIALIPNQGTWKCTNPDKREFVLTWEVGGWVDTLTMSADGNKVDAINNIGIQFQGTRIDSEAIQSGPEIKL